MVFEALMETLLKGNKWQQVGSPTSKVMLRFLFGWSLFGSLPAGSEL